jgi:2-methylcitrate dehydratase PrpD
VVAPREDTASALAAWAAGFVPAEEDLALARRSLIDTLAVTRAAAGHPIEPLAARLGEAGRLATLAHVLDYDDLHLPSTSHISAICVPVALAAGGDARAFLAGAGAMARLGEMLGWAHYGRGWHATCTAGAPAAAVTAAAARGLDAEATARAIALALPAAGGVQRAFGTATKSLQVGFAADAGVRAAELAAAGASADPAALDEWLGMVGGSPRPVASSPAVPGGLAIKPYPCCYALQRPIEAAREAMAGETVAVDQVASISVKLDEDVLRPLIHSRPSTGLEAKFSLGYALAATLLDGHPGLASFEDEAVARPAAQALVERVRVETAPGGGDLLSGVVEVAIELAGGGTRTAAVDVPSGAPARPLDEAGMREKVADCVGADAERLLGAGWDSLP